MLSHTSQGPPGETFCYQGNRFGFVFGVFGAATPEKFLDGEAVTRRILDPLGMEHTLPRPGVKITDSIRARLAIPYEGFDAKTGEPTPRPESARAERSLPFGRILLERQGPRAICHRLAKPSPDPGEGP